MRLIACLVLCMTYSSYGQAANPLTLLDLKPTSTLIAILDKGGKLTAEGNQRLFKAAGFHVVLLKRCSGSEEPLCVRKSLAELKERSGYRDVLLMTSASHTQTVYSLYAKSNLKDVLSGVILFRAEALFEDYPPLKTGPAPPLLLFGKEADEGNVVLASRRFADHMRRAGVRSWFVMLPEQQPPPSQSNQPPVVRIIYQFIGAGQKRGVFYEALAGRARWQHPPLDNDGFYEHPDFIKTYPIGDNFMALMKTFFHLDPPQLKQWAFKSFKGLDILAYRDKSAATKHARYLVLRNHLGKNYPIDLNVYGKYKPLIVAGIDYESNLFRMTWFYRTKAGYSWIKDEVRPKISVEPLGAFLYFQKRLPTELQIPLALRSALSFGSIGFSNENPLAGLGKLSPSLQKIMTRTTNCIFCHSLDGIGGRAHHLIATTAKAQPGFALPLRSYSRDVLRNFLFDQESAAAAIGMIPNPVSASGAKELFEYLTVDK